MVDISRVAQQNKLSRPDECAIFDVATARARVSFSQIPPILLSTRIDALFDHILKFYTTFLWRMLARHGFSR